MRAATVSVLLVCLVVWANARSLRVQLGAPDDVDTRYQFPTSNLKKPKTKVVLCAGGSVNPMTRMHLKMFEVARDHFNRLPGHEVVGAYLHPVTDFYEKSTLKGNPFEQRYKIANLLAEETDFLMVDPWAGTQQAYVTTSAEMDHTWKGVAQALQTTDFSQVMVVGEDLFRGMANGVKWGWDPDEVVRYSEEFTIAVLPRVQDGEQTFAESRNKLIRWVKEKTREGVFGKSVVVLDAQISDELSGLSSTKFRKAIKDGASREVLQQFSTPAVVEYIIENGLYGYGSEAREEESTGRDTASVASASDDHLHDPALFLKKLHTCQALVDHQMPKQGSALCCIGSDLHQLPAGAKSVDSAERAEDWDDEVKCPATEEAVMELEEIDYGR